MRSPFFSQLASCTREQSPRCSNGSSSSKPQSASSASRRSAICVPTSYDEIEPRRCHGCGRTTRVLRAVVVNGKWRERCDACAERQAWLLGLGPPEDRF